ncbi:DEAD/DEAH box helicase family protein [Bacillus sp. S/N-304-OC-R1]|uniref:DEAD/DEAH box helicase family protein n=1 Tax=Bacillus sp. S/N-304-OC-R1 TaxID=2758034 RepID=UPI001C8E131E|nr:DEAD/DEAH box helicase family protein [Bacillus sp. S/N-304-OC-R1]MBY0120923.1 DEAD/DEAH box helicase family protein [Bacillus sp. S/N-304-OC-R1]
MTTTLNIVDAPCGYGKTSWAIQYMNDMHVDTHKFIFVTPYLNEISRIRESVKSRNFVEPTVSNGNTKLEDLHQLLADGADICTTHSLFKMANDETKQLLEVNNYTLILDEVMNVIEIVPTRKNDLDVMLDSNLIELVQKENGLKYIIWNKNKLHCDSRFNNIKRLALTGNLIYSEKKAIIWNFPCDFFYAFEHVFLLTYLFRGQKQRYYYDLHNIRYRYLSVIKIGLDYSLIPYSERIKLNKEKLASLIHIYKGKLNDIGNDPYSLSKEWLEKKTKFVSVLRRNTYNYLTNMCKANKDTALWTTLKGGDKKKIQKKVEPKSFVNSFLSVNSRATNEHKHKYHLAYLSNRFMNPIEKGFFKQQGIVVDEKAWALSELIQWVWRSRIREELPINIYIPSSRMRNLFLSYLSSEVFEEAPENAITNEYPSDWNI